MSHKSKNIFDDDQISKKMRSSSVRFCDMYLRNREYGFRSKYGDLSHLHRELYVNMVRIRSCMPINSKTVHDLNNGVFNMEFSQDGKILVGAYESGHILLLDPVIQKPIVSLIKAHRSGVNNVKFLDSRIFATCSDDYTVALWDTRNLQNQIRLLEGHRSSVKSVEYSIKDNLLVSSGNDGSIFLWEINNYSEESRLNKKSLCDINGLMRIKLLPDSSKLIISTSNGFYLLVNSLDLQTLGVDFEGFNPIVYRLMMMNRTKVCYTATQPHVFTRKRNRLEFIADFPGKDNHGRIFSIQVHPYGWNVLSRYSSYMSEWTCVHDLRDVDIPTRASESEETGLGAANVFEHDDSMEIRTGVANPRDINHVTPFEIPTDVDRQSGTDANGDGRAPIRSGSQERDASTDRGAAPARVSGRRTVVVRTVTCPDGNTRDVVLNASADERGPAAAVAVAGGYRYRRRERDEGHPRRTYGKEAWTRADGTVERLTHFVEEERVRPGHFKEHCYSNDGRVICSPRGNGIDLLTFTSGCDEPAAFPDRSGGGVRLNRFIAYPDAHDSPVLSTKFSPVHPTIVSGCYAGRIVWHESRF